MVNDLVWALVAALIITLAGIAFARPRRFLAAWCRGVVRRVRLRLYLQRREDTQRAIERIAAELAQRRYWQDGNPDDELLSDWTRWFNGDPDANVDYERKQQRDAERLARGDFRPVQPRK